MNFITARAVLGSALLLGVALSHGCGGGDGGLWSGPSWDYDVTIFTDTGTCAPGVSLQQMEGDVSRSGSLVTVKVRIPAGNGCDEVVWTLKGSLLSGETWTMQDIPSMTLCRFQQDYGLGTFSVDHAQMDLRSDMSTFQYAANINVNFGGGACLGLLSIQGNR